jgi:hypothetical protein
MSKSLLMIALIILSVNQLFGTNFLSSLNGIPYLHKFVYFILGLSALCYLFSIYFQFPFLDKSYIPFSQLKSNNVPVDSVFAVTINVPAFSKVIYWSNDDKIQTNCTTSPFINQANSGITTADENGIASLQLKAPADGLTYDTSGRSVIFYRHSIANNLLSEIKVVKANEISVICDENCRKMREEARKIIPTVVPSSAPSSNPIPIKPLVMNLDDSDDDSDSIKSDDTPKGMPPKAQKKVSISSRIDVINDKAITQASSFPHESQVFKKTHENGRNLTDILGDRELCKIKPEDIYENDSKFFNTDLAPV